MIQIENSSRHEGYHDQWPCIIECSCYFISFLRKLSNLQVYWLGLLEMFSVPFRNRLYNGFAAYKFYRENNQDIDKTAFQLRVCLRMQSKVNLMAIKISLRKLVKLLEIKREHISTDFQCLEQILWQEFEYKSKPEL